MAKTEAANDKDKDQDKIARARAACKMPNPPHLVHQRIRLTLTKNLERVPDV
jgi:hypothetical protein